MRIKKVCCFIRANRGHHWTGKQCKILKKKIDRSSNGVEPLIFVRHQNHFVILQNDNLLVIVSLNVTKLACGTFISF